MLFERELDRLKALECPEQERQFKRLVQLGGRATVGETNATARLRELIAKLLGITATELKTAIKTEHGTKELPGNRSSPSKNNVHLEPR